MNESVSQSGSEAVRKCCPQDNLKSISPIDFIFSGKVCHDNISILSSFSNRSLLFKVAVKAKRRHFSLCFNMGVIFYIT